MARPKHIIREYFLNCKLLPEERATFLSGMICDRLQQTLLFREANCIALYCSTGNEVRTSELLDKYFSGNKYRTGKDFALPVIFGENMHFYPYTGKQNLKKGPFGILEPVSRELIPPDNIDLFIIPGVAFDLACNRLGRGKGYYDRYLSDINTPVIGLCFDYQLIDSIPCEAHDKKMTVVLTEIAIVLPPHQ